MSSCLSGCVNRSQQVHSQLNSCLFIQREQFLCNHYTPCCLTRQPWPPQLTLRPWFPVGVFRRRSGVFNSALVSWCNHRCGILGSRNVQAFFYCMFKGDWFILIQIQALPLQGVMTNTRLNNKECSMERSVSQCGKASF